jgi:16S rRNA (guanine966-N2)-methyltransferase
MRVIAGKYRSRPLALARGLELRPTADRLRETLFNVLTAGNPPVLENTIWADIYAGTGAVGIEALSRGAAMVYFLESSLETAKLIENNLRALGVKTGFEIIRQEAARALPKLQSRISAADFVFLDPPYRLEKEYARTLQSLGESKLKPACQVIAEHAKRFDPGDKFASLERYRILKQGDAALSFYRIAQG